MRSVAAVALALSMAATGCAEHITFHSFPEGAEVWLNGRDLGRTPTSAAVEYDAFTRYEVILQKDGYLTYRSALATQINSAALLGTIAGVFCFPCLASLIWIQKPMSEYTFTLTPSPAPRGPPAQPTPPAVGRQDDDGSWEHPTQDAPSSSGAGWGDARSPDPWPTPTETPAPEHF